MVAERGVQAAAVDRLAAFAATLDRIGLEDFRLMALSPMAAVDRAAARADAERTAAAAGLTELATEARGRVREHMDRVYAAGGYHPTWVTLNWGLSTGPVEDRVAATAAVEDAALGTIVDGLAPDDVVATLRGPFELIATVHPMPAGGDTLPGLDDLRRVGPLGAIVLVVVAVVVIADMVTPWAVGLALAVVIAVVIAVVVLGAWRWRRRERRPRGDR